MKICWPIVFLGILWWYMETDYFGWNRHPATIAELIADGASLLFYALAVVVGRLSPKVVVNISNNAIDRAIAARKEAK